MECTEAGGMEFALEDGAVTLVRGSCQDGTAEIPGTVLIGGEERPVSCIGKGAFAGLPVSYVALPENIVYVAEEAFSGCSELESVSMPAGIRFVGRRAFYGCLSLRYIDLPGGTECIGEEAFADCFLLESV
ncbi:MAG: leucine-rich repeat domain-containing protein, partial [Candidatus Methanomethylophilaceae archaeon]|nr:leucine-rich repeat domain-containing protein [Candidatus Methanomethylophilaceae archaeon]